MKRKYFIITASLTVIGLPLAFKGIKQYSQPDILTIPNLLKHFCDKKKLEEIGIDYRALTPAENEKQKLIDLIFAKNIKTLDNTLIAELLEKKIQEDFLSYKTIVLQGWVISITEARQCALLSLN
jgi:hypothetical protein